MMTFFVEKLETRAGRNDRAFRDKKMFLSSEIFAAYITSANPGYLSFRSVFALQSAACEEGCKPFSWTRLFLLEAMSHPAWLRAMRSTTKGQNAAAVNYHPLPGAGGDCRLCLPLGCGEPSVPR